MFSGPVANFGLVCLVDDDFPVSQGGSGVGKGGASRDQVQDPHLAPTA